MNFRVTLLLFLTVALKASASDWYVCMNASGSRNGTDWINAWLDVSNIEWSVIDPGDTVWIAGGHYGAMNIQASGTNNLPIYIKRVRATNSVPTQAAGWQTNFDATVIINTIYCSSANGYGNFMTIDGQIPYSGMIVTNTDPSEENSIDFGLDTTDNPGASYWKLVNLDIGGPVIDNVMTNVGDQRAVIFNYMTQGYGGYIGYCRLHNYATLLSAVNMSDWTVEHCKFYSNYRGNTLWHPNVFQTVGCTNVTFRYNEIYNWQNEGIMMNFFSTNDPPSVNWYIYGNIWHDGISGQSVRILESQNTTNGPVFVFNNTVANTDLTIRTANGGSWQSGCASSNNIYFNTAGNAGFGLGNDDYDLSDAQLLSEPHGISGASSNIFVNMVAQDYHIVQQIGDLYPRDKGAALGPPYNVDFDGNVRGADGNWDIGAYECQYIFQLLFPSISPQGVTISWYSKTGLTYFVQRSSHPGSSALFATIQSNIPGKMSATSFTDTNAFKFGASFYRISTQ